MNDTHAENDARQQRILDAATELIIRYGYDKTTISDIANASGVGKGTIYLHFAGKDELFAALLLREIRKYTAAWLTAIEADPRGGTLGGIYMNVLAALHSSPLMAAILRRDVRIFGGYLHKPNTILRANSASSLRAEFIRALQEAGTVRSDVDAAVIAHIMDLFSYGYVSIADFKDPAQLPPADAVFRTIALIMDRAFTPEGGGDSEAGKAVIRRLTATALEQLVPRQEAAP